MYNKTLFWTTFYSALFSILTLKFFHIFNFIKWSPVGWAKKWQLFATAHFTFKWVLLFIVLALLFAILYIAVSFTSSIPPSVTALIIGIIVVFAIEWTISSPETPIDANQIRLNTFFCNDCDCLSIYHRDGCFHEETFGRKHEMSCDNSLV